MFACTAAIEELEKEKSRIEQELTSHVCTPFQQQQHTSPGGKRKIDAFCILTLFVKTLEFG